jgi:hypothetical protein
LDAVVPAEARNSFPGLDDRDNHQGKTYDLTSGAFVRESELSGQVFVERPKTIGHGRLSLKVGYQWAHLDRFDDERIYQGLKVHEAIVGVTYGPTDDLELNLTVPVFSFGGAPGIEPIFLRGKYLVLDRPELQLAIGLVVRQFTDDLTNESVSGRVQPGLFVYASRKSLPLPHDVLAALHQRGRRL